MSISKFSKSSGVPSSQPSSSPAIKSNKTSTSQKSSTQTTQTNSNQTSSSQQSQQSQQAIQAKKAQLTQRAEKQELPSHRSTQSLMLSRQLNQTLGSAPTKSVAQASGTTTPSEPRLSSKLGQRLSKESTSSLPTFRPVGDIALPRSLSAELRGPQSLTHSQEFRDNLQLRADANAETGASKSNEPATVEEHQVALEQSQAELARAEVVLQHAPGPSARYQQQVQEAEQAVEENTQALVVTQQDANQQAVEEDRPLPYPATAGLDTSGSPAEVSEQIARLPQESQTEILGSTSHISPYEIAQRDTQRITTAAAQGPEQAAQALQDTVGQEGVDPAYQQRVLEQSQPAIEQLGASLNEQKNSEVAERTVGVLAEVSEKLGPDNTAILARGIAKDWPNGDLKKLDDGIEAAVLEGKGTTFAVQLANELYKTGKGNGGKDVSEAVAKSVGELSERFETAQNKVDDHNERLAHLVGTQSELLTDDQLQQAIQADRGRNQGDFDDLETTAALLASTVPGLGPVFDQDSAIAEAGGFNLFGGGAAKLQVVGAGVAAQIPDLAGTASGSAVVGQMLEQSGQGRPTALDHLGDVVERFDDPDKVRGELSVALTQSASATVLAGGTQGTGLQTMSTHNGLIHQLEKLEVLTPGSPESAELKSAFEDLFHSEPGQVQQAAGTLLDVLNDGRTLAKISPEFKDALKDSLKVHSLALDTATVLFDGHQTLNNLSSDWKTGDALERSQLLTDVLELGADGATAALKIADQAGRLSAASKAAWLGTNIDDVGGLANLKHVGKLPAVGVFVNGVTGVFEGAQAVDALSDGRYLDASIHGVSAAGAAVGAWSALSAAGVVGAIPGGQLVAAGLLVAGLGLNQVKTVQTSNKNEGPTEQFLVDAGIPQNIAEELSNHDNKGRSAGPVLAQVASRFGMSGPEFYDYLQTLPPGQVKAIVTHAHGVDPNSDGVFQLGHPEEVFIDGFGAGRSINGLANWLVQNELSPGSVVNFSPYTGSSFVNDGGPTS